jgi:tRNA A-37 threonylcarbamoyl transferase component Bud32
MAETDCFNDELLLALAEDRLPTEQLADVHAHAGECSSCRILLAEAVRACESARERPTLRVRSLAEQPGGPDASRWSQYTLEGPIARGGMATLYKVIDHRIGRRVAMKILNEAFAQNSIERKRFFNEARIMAELDHPNIVPVHDLGHDEMGRPFFTMKLVRGETLTRKLAGVHDITFSLDAFAPCLEIFLKVCDAVAFAHSRGVLHRDIKPDNILIGSFGEVYLMDWGLACIARPERFETGDTVLSPSVSDPALDPKGQVAGTFHYMAPEQAYGRNQLLDERTDIFLLGATLYYILTGRPPYPPMKDVQAALSLAREAQIVPPDQSARWSCLPPAISLIAMKAMARDPAKRFQSIAELQLAVRRFLHGGFHLPTKTFAAGSIIMEEGAPGDAAYVIVRGTCQVFRILRGKKFVLRRMGPGEVFGETAILSSRPRSASVEALEELTVMVVTAELLTEELGLNTWVGTFAKTLAERFREADERRFENVTPEE